MERSNVTLNQEVVGCLLFLVGTATPLFNIHLLHWSLMAMPSR